MAPSDVKAIGAVVAKLAGIICIKGAREMDGVSFKVNISRGNIFRFNFSSLDIGSTGAYPIGCRSIFMGDPEVSFGMKDAMFIIFLGLDEYPSLQVIAFLGSIKRKIQTVIERISSVRITSGRV